MTALLVVIGISLAISFACSILEAVLLSISHSYVGVLQEKGHPAGDLLARMRESIDEPIAAILTLNTIAHTVGAAMGGALALEVFGRISEKTLGATYWQSLAPLAAWVLRAMIVIMKPVLVPLALLNRLIAPRRARRHTVSRAEREVLAAIGRREGTIDQEEWQILTNIMNLDEVSVGQVMTPRTRIVAVPLEASLDEAERVMIEQGRLRLPVFQGSLDRIVGLLLARDLWRAARAGVTDLGAVMRKPTFIPDTKPVEDTLRLMRLQRIQMAIVLDEYGGTAGLVTLEDLIEEIVGEIEDEHEPDLPSFVDLPDGRVRILGSVPVDEVNERLALDLPEEEYDSIGGCVFGLLGRIPEVGDEVRFAGGVLRVLEMVSRRVEKVEFVPAAQEEDTAG